jgi:ElaB/YqjD/DUF883 family membrane-anchored ribosome-binding protein
MQQHEINTEVNNLLQSLTKCVKELTSTANQQLNINKCVRDELIKVFKKIIQLEQRVMLLEGRNEIIDHAEEIVDVRSY